MTTPTTIAAECARSRPSSPGWETCLHALAAGWVGASDLCGPCTRQFMAALDGLAGPLVWHPDYQERAECGGAS